MGLQRELLPPHQSHLQRFDMSSQNSARTSQMGKPSRSCAIALPMSTMTERIFVRLSKPTFLARAYKSWAIGSRGRNSNVTGLPLSRASLLRRLATTSTAIFDEISNSSLSSGENRCDHKVNLVSTWTSRAVIESPSFLRCTLPSMSKVAQSREAARLLH